MVEEQVSEGQDEKAYRTYTSHDWDGTPPQSVHLAPSLRRKVFVVLTMRENRSYPARRSKTRFLSDPTASFLKKR